MSNKPSNAEEEFFVREEAEKLKRLSLEKSQKMAKEEKERLKQLHWMHCPKCGMQLHSMVLRGITIDRCFDCHGVYLDDSEFQKLTGDESSIIQGFLNLFKKI